jgi:hypothetical protein
MKGERHHNRDGQKGIEKLSANDPSEKLGGREAENRSQLNRIR